MKPSILFLLIIFCAPIAAYAENVEILAIAYTSSLNGNIDSCACKSSPKGGLIKRGTAVKKLRRKYHNLLLVDTGDFMPSYIDNTLPDYIAKAYEYLKYDAIAFGDQDLDIGIDRFLRITENLPIASTNASFTTAAQTLPGYRISKKGGFTIAVISVQDTESYTYALSATRAGIRIDDIASSVNRTVSFLREKEHPDAVLMLIHSTLIRTIEVEKMISGVDIIIGGHDQSFTEKPVTGDHAVISFPGPNGSRIGIMEIERRNGRISIKNNSFILPDRNNTADDPFIRGLIDDYRNKME